MCVGGDRPRTQDVMTSLNVTYWVNSTRESFSKDNKVWSDILMINTQAPEVTKYVRY